MKEIGKGNELRRFRERFTRLPLGDRAVGHSQLLCELLLRHSCAAAQSVKIITKFIHRASSCFFFIVQEEEGKVKAKCFLFSLV